MKLMSEDHHQHSNGSSRSNNNGGLNWLGFSLSPHSKIEVASSPTSTSSPVAAVSEAQVVNPLHHQPPPGVSMFLSSPHHPLTSPSLCFDAAGGHGGFLSSPLSIMPLKSDGSLCIMEALTRSQPPQAPKLGNFLGGETMGLSLDSLYYHHHHQQQQQQHHQHQHFDPYFSLLGSQTLYQLTGQDGLLRNWQPHSEQQPQPQPQPQQQHQNSYSCGVLSDDQVNVNHTSSINNNSVSGVGYGDHHFQCLSLSMSPSSQSQSSCVTGSTAAVRPEGGLVTVETNKRGFGKLCQKQTVHRKSIDSFGQRTSQYRGVTKHRWTGRYEAHLWDNSCKKEGQTRKGRQGGYDMEEKAARAYDLAALKYWGLSTHTNFPMENYKEEIEEMKHMTRQEYVAHLRRKSSGFSRGASMYRGVTRHHQHGRWQARIGRVAGNKDLYLGTFSTQEEAAEAYDIAAIKFRGVNAVTNFDISRYDVEKILASNNLLAGEQAKRSRVETIEGSNDRSTIIENIGDSIPTIGDDGKASEWKMMLCHSPDQQQQQSYGNTSSFSLAQHDLVGLEAASPAQRMVEDSANLGSAQFSNTSSLVTSLNCSRKGSPDRHGNGSSSSSLDSKFVAVNAWTPSAAAQLRPAAAAAIPLAQTQLSVFATWGET